MVMGGDVGGVVVWIDWNERYERSSVESLRYKQGWGEAGVQTDVANVESGRGEQEEGGRVK